MRLKYYKSSAHSLNRIIYYMFFAGTWRDDSLTDVIDLKRHVDTTSHSGPALQSRNAHNDRRPQVTGRQGRITA
jgi:hypothetical protein